MKKLNIIIYSLTALCCIGFLTACVVNKDTNTPSISLNPSLKECPIAFEEKDEYIDCIVQEEKTISFEKGKKPKGLLDDKERAVVYIQSSGGNIPWILDPIMDKGENYVAQIMKAMGIKNVQELKVDATGTTEEERENAIREAEEKIDSILDRINLE